jgi:Amidohydrolase
VCLPDSPHPDALVPFEVASDAYLAFARDLGSTEAAFRMRCLARLPLVVFDAHSHANGGEAYLGLSKYGQRQVRSSFPKWSLEDSMSVRELTYGNRQVRFLRFAQPYRGIDHRVANAYLSSYAPASDLLALCGLPNDPDYTIDQLRSGRWAALKMYPHYFEPEATELRQFFPDEIVIAAAELGIPLILHPHRPITSCYGELLALADRHPEIRIILAHLGREFLPSGQLTDVWRLLSAIPGLVADTSMICDATVIASAFQHLGMSRVLYGSDEPCNLLRYITYQHPELGQRVSSDFPYHWLRKDLLRDYGHLGKGAWLNHFQSLKAIFEAVDIIAGSDDQSLVHAVFHDNAVSFLSVSSSAVALSGEAGQAHGSARG